MWVPHSHLCLAPHLQAHACACTCVVQKCLLVQTRWGLCAQKGKEKQEKIFLLWFLSLLINPPVCSHRCTNAASLAERVPPLLPTTPALLPSSTQTLEREHSVSPGTAQARAGYANTNLASAVPSRSSTRVRARALSPSSLCPLHPLPVGTVSCPAPVTLHPPQNQIYCLSFSLFAFNIFTFCPFLPVLLVHSSHPLPQQFQVAAAGK